MAAANNMKELNSMLSKELRKAMREAANHAEKDMREETTGFYKGTTPSVYERTGALGNTPRVSAIVENQHGMSFDAYLDTSHQYTTGDNPGMEKVLNLANYDIRWASYVKPTLGKERFWESALMKIDVSFDKAIGRFFTKT